MCTFQEFAKIKLKQYMLCKEGDIYYLAKPLSPRERKESGCFVASKIKEESATQLIEIKHESTLCETSEEIKQTSDPLENAEVNSQISDTSSFNGSALGTDGGK